MSKTLKLRDNHAETTVVISEIAAFSLSRKTSTQGGTITLILKGGKEIVLWFNADEVMDRLQRLLQEALD